MENKKGYELYYNKRERKIEVRLIGTISNFIKPTEKVTFYNSCYYVCLDKQKLFDKAEEIRNKWVTEAEEHYNKMLNVKIKKTVTMLLLFFAC